MSLEIASPIFDVRPVYTKFRTLPRRKAAVPPAFTLPPPVPQQRTATQQQPKNAAAVAGSQNVLDVDARATANTSPASAVGVGDVATVADDDVAGVKALQLKSARPSQKTGIRPSKVS